MHSLKCERLSFRAENADFIQGFTSLRNPLLADKLLSDGFDEDESEALKYYIVKNKNNEVLFFFSLKCGQLHEPYLKTDQQSLFDEFARFINGRAISPEVDAEEKMQAWKIQEKLRNGNGLSKFDLEYFDGRSELIDRLIKICNLDEKHVLSTYAGVELVHFCANDSKRSAWPLEEKLGISVFWYSIVPIILRVMEFVGCSYIFLFAADTTEDETLIKYYKQLGFEDARDKVSVFPSYDEFCRFMFKGTKHLKKERDAFLA